MTKNLDEHERIVHRLKIASGHLIKVVEMAEKDEYCIDIVHQSQAVQKALHEVDMLLLEKYLKKCICQDKTNDENVLAEIMKAVRKGE